MCGFVEDIVDDVVDTTLDVLNDVVDAGLDLLGLPTSFPETPEIPDYSEQIQEFEARGILVNKFVSNAHIPVVYGTRKLGGNIVFLESSGTDNEFLFMALVLCEGEIDSVEKIFVNENEVTFSGSLADNTERTVASSDSNFFKADPAIDGSSAESLITVRCHYGTDGQAADSILSSLSSINNIFNYIFYKTTHYKAYP